MRPTKGRNSRFCWYPLRAHECAAAIERKTHQKTLVAETPARAIDNLEEHDIDVWVIDESLQHARVGTDNLVDTHAGLAVPVYVNLSTHSVERVAQDVNCGLHRLVSERAAATQVAASALRNELRGEVTVSAQCRPGNSREIAA